MVLHSSQLKHPIIRMLPRAIQQLVCSGKTRNNAVERRYYMTANQIAYWNMVESKRSNLAREGETKRANLAKEAEDKRSHLTNEQHARDQLAETRRHQSATEAIDTKKADAAWAQVDVAKTNAATQQDKVAKDYDIAERNLSLTADKNLIQQDYYIDTIRNQQDKLELEKNLGNKNWVANLYSGTMRAVGNLANLFK